MDTKELNFKFDGKGLYTVNYLGIEVQFNSYEMGQIEKRKELFDWLDTLNQNELSKISEILANFDHRLLVIGFKESDLDLTPNYKLPKIFNNIEVYQISKPGEEDTRDLWERDNKSIWIRKNNSAIWKK